MHEKFNIRIPFKGKIYDLILKPAVIIHLYKFNDVNTVVSILT